MKKFIISVILLSIASIGFALHYPHIHISKKQALRIGVKIWYNESAGSIKGLTSWSPGEDFASLGIGHFIWYPKHRDNRFKESFPNLIRYMENHGATLPTWLEGNNVPYCPWKNRKIFIKARNSKKMSELRSFLYDSIPTQCQFIANRLERSIPRIIRSAPWYDRQLLSEEISTLAKTPDGIYIMMDYVNFKGEGIHEARKHKSGGWGLLQVLQKMRDAPKNENIHHQFVWAANFVLTNRIKHSPNYQVEKRWLPGWRRRLMTYLD